MIKIALIESDQDTVHEVKILTVKPFTTILLTFAR